MPNEPPTLPVRTCTLSGVVFIAAGDAGLQAHHALAARSAACSAPWPCRSSPIAARGSIALTISRVLLKLELDLVRGAGEGRVRPSRCRRSGSRARRCPARRRRSPARRLATACAGVVTAGSGSMSTSIASAASLACASVSATTQAIGSPTKRTLSVGSAGRGRLLHVGAVAALERQRRLEGAVGRQVGAGVDRRARPASSWRRRC